MARAAGSGALRKAFETHRQETEGHVNRLEQVFGTLQEKVRGKHCDGMAGIIEEGKAVMEENFEATTLDACLIASAQRADAANGRLRVCVAWARAMGHSEAAVLLQEILDQEKVADEKLTTLAEGGINQEAAERAHGVDAEPAAAAAGPEGRPPRP